MANAERKPIFRSLGAMPPVGSRGNAPGRGSGGFAPLKLTTFLPLKGNLNNKNCIIFSIFMQSIMLQFLQ